MKKLIDDEPTDYVGKQKYVEVALFDQWINNFFEISSLIESEDQMDRHHCRWFFIALWELFVSGLVYVEREISLPVNSNSEYLKTAKNYILKLKSLFSDDEYFMLQYYRHSASHIFQHRYSWTDEKGNLKSDGGSSFKTKNGESYKLSQEQIREKAKCTIGEYGLNETSFKRSLICRTYDLITKWANENEKIINSLNSLPIS